MKPYYPPSLITGWQALDVIESPDDIDWDDMVWHYAMAVADTELVMYLRQTKRSPDKLLESIDHRYEYGWMAFSQWLMYESAPVRTLDVYMGVTA